MIANSNQTGTLDVSRRSRSIRLGVVVGWFIIGLVIATLLMGLIWNKNVTPYPGAERQEANQLKIQYQPTLNLSQGNSYQTLDDLVQVMSWYSQHFGLGHEMPQGENCVRMTRVDPHMFFQQSLAVTLCAQSKHTLIFINRSIALR